MYKPSLWIVAASTLAAVPAAAAQDDSLGSILQRYDCQVAYPMETFTLDSLARPGSILAQIRTVKSGAYNINYLLADDNGLAIKHWASSTGPLPTANAGVDTTNYKLTTTAGVTFTAEIQNIMNLSTIKFSYLNDVSAEIKDVNFYHPSVDKIAAMVAEGMNIPFIKNKVINPSTSRVIVSTCVANVTYTFHFKTSVSIDLVNLQIPKINATFGFNANWSREIGADGHSVTYASKSPVIVGINYDKTSEYKP